MIMMFLKQTVFYFTVVTHNVVILSLDTFKPMHDTCKYSKMLKLFLIPSSLILPDPVQPPSLFPPPFSSTPQSSEQLAGWHSPSID